MNIEKEKIKSFVDLYAWQEGHKLVLMIYEITIIVNKLINGLIKKTKSFYS